MAANNWFFFYQLKGGEDAWRPDLADRRALITASHKPAFVSVLDVSNIPEDNQWDKVKYRGPLYFDFDADGDLELVCDKFKDFLGKLTAELEFDVSQARLYASGGKGFHVEIPQECFLLKVPAVGISWLPYIYRDIAQSLMVDTLDINVYSGKRGRMWRTTGVQRDNGNYKVQITLEEALEMTPDFYREVIQQPREIDPPTPPWANPQFAMLFEKAKTRVQSKMRGKKHRQAKAHEVLDRWIKARKTPPSVELLMSGEGVADGAGFQALAMQIAIYAASVGMPLTDLLTKCEGLVANHVGDGWRYGTPDRRRKELVRMYEYMQSNDLYDFEVGPIVSLLKAGTPTADLGTIETTDTGDIRDGAPVTPLDKVDPHLSVRRGFIMNADGMWSQKGDKTDSLCRATLRNAEQIRDLETGEFEGYEVEIVVGGKSLRRTMLPSEAFQTAGGLRKFLVTQQLSYQGGESETMALLDIMAEKSETASKTYTFPREGLFIVDKPGLAGRHPVKVYLTQDTFLSSAKAGEEGYFQLRYRPNQATSIYNIDLHRAPDLTPDMLPTLHDLFHFNKPDVVADMLGWFVAAHFRSFYLHLFRQFPLLQIYGPAGSGKSQTVLMLASLHWYQTPVSLVSALASTPFTLDNSVSTSTSAPLMIDEYKPRELRAMRGKLEKLKDLFKNVYTASDVGGRGTVNRGAANALSIVRSKATAPVLFIGEALETETAIIERCTTVQLSPAFHTKARYNAFRRLQSNTTPLSALGKAMIQAAFKINLDEMRAEVEGIIARFDAQMPDFDDPAKRRVAPRLIYNRAVIVHALSILKRVLHAKFGAEFDEEVDSLLQPKQSGEETDAERATAVHGIAEISKVMNTLARLSRERGVRYEMVKEKDYTVGDGHLDVKVESAYARYRLYSADIHDTPLFDNLEAFLTALSNWGPCINPSVASSPLQDEDGAERVMRFDSNLLRREGVQTFRT